jgi:hypothetical protein
VHQIDKIHCFLDLGINIWAIHKCTCSKQSSIWHFRIQKNAYGQQFSTDLGFMSKWTYHTSICTNHAIKYNNQKPKIWNISTYRKISSEHIKLGMWHTSNLLYIYTWWYKFCIQFGCPSVSDFLLLDWKLILQPEYRKHWS